jgi:hypothetical protein
MLIVWFTTFCVAKVANIAAITGHTVRALARTPGVNDEDRVAMKALYRRGFKNLTFGDLGWLIAHQASLILRDAWGSAVVDEEVAFVFHHGPIRV